jgi:hypothetical protein
MAGIPAHQIGILFKGNPVSFEIHNLSSSTTQAVGKIFPTITDNNYITKIHVIYQYRWSQGILQEPEKKVYTFDLESGDLEIAFYH